MYKRRTYSTEQTLTWTKARLSLLIKVFSFRIVTSSEATLTVMPTTKFLMPKDDMSGASNEERIAGTLSLTIRKGFPACGDEFLEDLESNILKGDEEVCNVQGNGCRLLTAGRMISPLSPELVSTHPDAPLIG